MVGLYVSADAASTPRSPTRVAESSRAPRIPRSPPRIRRAARADWNACGGTGASGTRTERGAAGAGKPLALALGPPATHVAWQHVAPRRASGSVSRAARSPGPPIRLRRIGRLV